MKKNILWVLIGSICLALPLYLFGKNNSEGGGIIFLNSKHRDAIDCAKYLDKWNDSYNDGAKTACSMFDRYLGGRYESMRFVTYPAHPYYFMTAHIERELSSIRAIDINHGVIDRKDENALQTFVKHIHILDTEDSAKHLAEMIHCFHAGAPMRLVTEYQKEDWRAEQNEPKFTKNEDGSVTLVYDLIHTGRSNSVRKCTLNVTSDYKVSLDCVEKEKTKKSE